TSDDSCALEWSQRAVEALKAAGKDATLYTYPGEPHEFIDAWPTVMKRTVEFFDKYVKNIR
ncbi:MAG: peptidase S9, partial [Patescibacteria group bacterium]